MNRSMNSAKNIATGLINKMLLMIMAFFVRTLFIRYLGAEYNGLNSLFMNILSILSLAEFGIGNVLMFTLYSALKNHDENKIASLTYEFKKMYRIIILIILFFGLIVMLFVPLIVNSSINMINVYIYYLLYLFNSISTYFVIYRTTVINADQKNYIVNITTTITTTIMYILQIISLIIFKNFLIYLIIQVVCNIGNNVILNIIAIKKYPYLKKIDKIKSDNSIDKKDILKNIKATFIYKISDTILDQTDSIIISIMLGTLYVGYYSNYFLIITYMVNIAAIIANGLLASFGNLNAENNMEKSYKMFKASMLAFCCFGVICSVCYVCSIQDFIQIWIGEKYLMNYDLVLSVVFVFYLRMVTNSMWMYRTSMGLFKEVQYMSLVCALLNIVLSIILGKVYGLAGIIIATGISRLMTTFWYEGKVLYKKFNVSSKKYILRQIKDFMTLIISLIFSIIICNCINTLFINHLILFIIKNIICILITSIILFIIYHNSEEFNTIIEKLKSIIRNKNRRNI